MFKERYSIKSFSVLLTAVLFLLLTTLTAFAEKETEKEKETKKPEVTINTHYWQESGTERLDYTMYFTVISYKDFRFRYDFMDIKDRDNLSRYWLYAGRLPVVKGDDLSITVMPCVHWHQRGETFYGGDVIIRVPKVNLSIVQRSVGGEHADKHYTFADLGVYNSKNVKGFVSYYLYQRMNASPDAYIGPKIQVGDFHVWYGFGAARSGASLLNLSATVRF